MVASVDKKVNFIKLWLKRSNFEPIENKVPVSDGPTDDIKTLLFVEIDLFIVLKVKCTQLPDEKLPPKELTRRIFFEK